MTRPGYGAISAMWMLAAILAAGAFAQPRAAAADSAAEGNAHALIRQAEQVFEGTVTNPRFREAVANARAIVIFPSLLKAGYFVGGQSGEGVLLVHDAHGDWSYPAFYRILGGSFGLQIGISVSQLVLVVRTERALERILGGNVELGGDLTLAIGPEALDTSVDTSADILSFTTTQGLYAGISVQGSTLIGSDARNLAYYGEAVSARDIVLGARVSNPQADGLRDELVFYVGAIERDRQLEGGAAN